MINVLVCLLLYVLIALLVAMAHYLYCKDSEWYRHDDKIFLKRDSIVFGVAWIILIPLAVLVTCFFNKR